MDILERKIINIIKLSYIKNVSCAHAACENARCFLSIMKTQIAGSHITTAKMLNIEIFKRENHNTKNQYN